MLTRHGAAVLRTAKRFSLTVDDAEDAYQRGLEILLTKAPTTREEELLPWLRTVVKHEALAIRRQRQRSTPTTEDETALERAVLEPASHEQAERYERLRLGAEALKRLKPQEIRCLVLRAEGYSYDAICQATGWTYTYVDGVLRSSVPRSCDYTEELPCSNEAGATHSLDTTTLSNGAHTLEVAALNAAGDERRSAPRLVHVSNASSPPAPPSPPPPLDTTAPPPASSATRSSPRLDLTSATIRRGRLYVRGTISRLAREEVTVTYSTRRGRRTTGIERSKHPRGGRFSFAIRLPSALRNASRGRLTVHYPGDAQLLRSTRRISLTPLRR